MKTDMMDRLEHYLSRHRGKGLVSHLIHFGIFLFMVVYVVLKPLLNMLIPNKLKLK